MSDGHAERMIVEGTKTILAQQERIAELERHNELLQRVAQAAKTFEWMPFDTTFTGSGAINYLLTPDERKQLKAALQAAVDAGALDEDGEK